VPGNPIAAAREIADHAKRLARLELELRAAQVKPPATKIGIGSGLGLTAFLLLPLLLGFVLAAVAAGFATTLSVWLSILIATGILLLLIAILALVAASLIRSGKKGFEDANL
jgi:hypothetical protein